MLCPMTRPVAEQPGCFSLLCSLRAPLSEKVKRGKEMRLDSFCGKVFLKSVWAERG